MSGGSYDYLCHAWGLEDVLTKREQLERMVERLARLGYAQDAAVETQTLIADLRAAEVRVAAALQRLTPVWKAVEWWDSGDWGEERLKAELAEYRGVA